MTDPVVVNGVTYGWTGTRWEPVGHAEPKGRADSQPLVPGLSEADIDRIADRVCDRLRGHGHDDISRGDTLTVEEAADVLRIGRTAAYDAIRNGSIPSFRVGRKIRVPRAQLERMLR